MTLLYILVQGIHEGASLNVNIALIHLIRQCIICCCSWHVTEDYGHTTVPLPALAQSVKTIYHLYRIGPAKPITITSVSEPFTNPTKHLMHTMSCKSPIIQNHHRQLLPISSHIPFTQSQHVLPSHYSLFSFIPVFLLYSLSLPSQFFAVILFGQ